MCASYYDWTSGAAITRTRMNAPYDASGNLQLVASATVGITGQRLGLYYTKSITGPTAFTTTLDAATSSLWTQTITENTATTISNFVTGQVIICVITGSGGDFTWTPSSAGDTYLWAGGVDNKTVSDGSINIYTLAKVGTNVFVNASKDYASL